MNNPRSRTLEFRQAYDSAKARAAPAHNKARQPKAQGSKSEVARLAGGIARDIQSTTEKLQKLAQRESCCLGTWVVGATKMASSPP